MNFSIWDNLDKEIEAKTNIEEASPNSSLTDKRRARTARSSSSLPESQPQDKSPQGSENEAAAPTFDEAVFWQMNEGILASVPEENRNPLKLGILEEFILDGLRSGANKTALLLAATLGLSIANNDMAFYAEVKQNIAK